MVKELLKEGVRRSATLKVEGEFARKKASFETMNMKQYMRKVSDGRFTDAVMVLTSSGVAPKNEETLGELEKKHPSASCPIFPTFCADVEAVSATK